MAIKLYVIDRDYCPENDAILAHNSCKGCTHYRSFKLEDGLRCVCCSYYDDLESSATQAAES